METPERRIHFWFRPAAGFEFQDSSPREGFDCTSGVGGYQTSDRELRL